MLRATEQGRGLANGDLNEGGFCENSKGRGRAHARTVDPSPLSGRLRKTCDGLRAWAKLGRQ